MDILKEELSNTKERLYSSFYARAIIIKIVLFIIIFSALFWYIRLYNLLPEDKLEQDLRSIPTLFAAGNFMYSLFTAFIVQTQWTKWDRLIEANRGEINMLRQLFIFAHHFPKPATNQLRYQIYLYLKTYIDATTVAKPAVVMKRSRSVDNALIKIEDTVFTLAKKHPDIGDHLFGYLKRAMEFRELKLQLTNQRLPRGLRLFVMIGTFSVIAGSLFVPFNNIIINYYFTTIVALFAFGIYLIIEDFDYPYRPGNFVLSVRLYSILKEEVKLKLKQRGFDVEKADQEIGKED